ncbi:PEP-CTERM sorting domain-containing protein [Piscinibacter sp. HJYY11]|uniref:PEP-CTERM sorting domain-containing protein n=1 Tax=Piscinibacter sp. HJYY11 TaxID=2801333 RepID=UPI00191F79A8|nr:PEP-CTERM sorting domain-containing protein [Piscinibacter sp. HJYY11]MBL0730703.1 PEP-CTERM sorting domain-containing protein [Piscinibacter sp. HJYY11]
MKNKLIACLATTVLSFGAVSTAQAALNSCDDPLKSGLGQRFCFEKFEDLSSGLYNVSFEYQAEKFAGTSDKTLSFGFLFDTLDGPSTRGLLSDVTSSSGWNSYSFTTTAGGDGGLVFALRGVPGPNFGLQLQNVQVTPVPEPGVYAMLLAGLGALAFVGRRRKL